MIEQRCGEAAGQSAGWRAPGSATSPPMKKTRGASRLDGSLLPLLRRTARMPCIFGFRAVA